MNAIAKRKKIHAYLDKADDNFVEIVYQLVTYSEKSSSEKSMLTEDQKRKLDKTIKRYESGKSKVYTLSEVKEHFMKKRMKN